MHRHTIYQLVKYKISDLPYLKGANWSYAATKSTQTSNIKTTKTTPGT